MIIWVSVCLFVLEEMKQMDGRIVAGVDGTKISLHIRKKNLPFHVLSVFLLHQLEVRN